MFLFDKKANIDYYIFSHSGGFNGSLSRGWQASHHLAWRARLGQDDEGEVPGPAGAVVLRSSGDSLDQRLLRAAGAIR